MTDKNYLKLWQKNSESKKLLISNLIPKKINSRKPHSKKSGKHSLTGTTRDHCQSCNKSLTMKDVYVKIFLKKCRKNKSYRTKNWLPKFQRWIILYKINRRSFNSKGKIYRSSEFDEKSLTVDSGTTENSHDQSK